MRVDCAFGGEEIMQYLFDNVSEEELIAHLAEFLKQGKKEEADGLGYLIALHRLYMRSSR